MKFSEDAANDGGTSTYIRLKDKESVVGIFRGDPYHFYSLWEDKKSRIVEKGTKGAKFRFKLNFLIKDGASWLPWIFENGKTVYKQLMEINGEYPLETTYLKITRNGSEMDTTYSILPMLKQTLTPEATALLETIPLHSLEPKADNEVDPEVQF